MKFLILFALAFLFSFGVAKAAPFKAFDKNPNVVAYFPTGPHGVPDESGIFHEGEDLVLKAGNGGVFQQWFYGFANEDGGITEGDHTVWRPYDGGNIPNGWTFIPEPFGEWGDYFEPGLDYIVKTNDFKSPGHHNP